jgi:hypothetical protein
VHIVRAGDFFLEERMNPLLLFGLALLPLAATMTDPQTDPPFQAKQALRTGAIHVDGPIEKVFPLFTPIEEKRWAPGWDPKPVWPQSGETVEGMVFTVDETLGRVFWVVTHYDPQRHQISYTNVLAGQTLSRIEIACKAAGTARTDCTVRYAFVGLSEEGNKFVEMHTEEAYANKLQHWVKAINHALKTGSRLEHY